MTITGYKLLNTKSNQPGKLFPLYINADKETPIGVWLKAEEGERTERGKVKSKLGELKYCPGWHLSDIPYVKHIGIKGKSGNIEYINPNHVWVECEVSADVNYQEEANRNGLNAKGKIIPKNADLDHIPVNGYYRYKTNPNMEGEWLICGAMKIVRVLDDKEVKEICNKNGYEPLPRYSKIRKK